MSRSSATEARPGGAAGLGELAVGLGALLAYGATLAPGLLPADAGEYQVVGALLGVAHPPGFALYTLLSWLITRWPGLAPALAINALSAVMAAATLMLVTRAVRVWTGAPGAGLLAALVLAAATTFWAQATTANIRMFTALAVALALAALAEYQRALRQKTPAAGPLALTALALGLAVSHHGSTVFLAAALGVYALILDPRVLRRPWPLLAGLLPFLAWLYFPLRAGAFGSPANARTWAGFLDQILARGWSGDMLAFATPEALPERLRVLGVLLAFQWSWVLLGLIALGAVLLVRRERGLGAALLTAGGLQVFIAITYRAPQTSEYLLPAYVVMAVWAGCGGVVLFRLPEASDLAPGLPADQPPRLRPGRAWRYGLGFAVVVTALAAAAAQLSALWPAYRALAQDESTRTYAESLLRDAPPNALVLANWHWITPLWYLREVEGQRPDVEVRYVVPRGASYAQNWVAEIAAALPERPVIVTSFFKPEYAAAGYRFSPLGLAWEAQAAPRLTAPDGLSGGQSFDAVALLGFQFETASSQPADGEIAGRVAWRVAGPPRDLSFFVHLIGPDGRLYGQQDVSYSAGRYVEGEVLLDRFTLAPLPEAGPGEYVLVAGAYQPDGTRLAEAQLGTVTLTPRATPPPTAHPLRRAFGAATLVGWDVDRTLPDSQRLWLHWQLAVQPADVIWQGTTFALPAGPGYLSTALDLPPEQVLTGLASALAPARPDARYVPFGRDLVLAQAAVTRDRGRVIVEVTYLAARPITRDLVVKVDLVGAGWRVQADAVPVGGALPTLKWVTGSVIHDRYELTLPAEAPAGPVQVVLGWYDGFTQQDLPILDPRLAQLGPTVTLATVEVRP